MSWLITNLLASVLLPPLSLLLLLILGLWLLRRHAHLGKSLVALALAALWLAATPYVADAGLHWLEGHTRPLDLAHQPAEAIVILGGGTYFSAPEFGGQDAIDDMPLMRLRYGARLQRATGRPIAVSGGTPLGNRVSEAQLMRTTLQQDFRVPVRWVEGGSSNTFENARLTYAQLDQAGIHRIYLVTHAWHMPRSAETFRRAGFQVVEAPTGFTTRYQTTLLTWLPSADALRHSSIFVHELIGLAWYQLRHQLS